MNLAPGSDRHDEAAARWAWRCMDGLSAQDRDELAAWLGEDPGNAVRLESYRRVQERLGRVVPEMVRAGEIAATGRDGAQMGRPRRLVFLRASLAMAAALAVTFTVWWWLSQRAETIMTQAGNRQSVTLADGSHVDLNARTSLEVELHGQDRLVQLQDGEAYFAVSKDRSRPFYVKTPAGVVRVTGTAFNVRVEAGTLEVTVLEGAVRVTESRGRHELMANDQLVVSSAAEVVRRLDPAVTRDVIAWREGRMIFDSERLDVAVQRFARYHGCTIHVARDIAQLEIGGRFNLDDLENFLAGIQVSLPVRVIHLGDSRIKVVAR